LNRELLWFGVWGFIFYDELITFYQQNKSHKKIKVSEFERLSKMPKLKKQKQPTIKIFARYYLRAL